MEGTLHRRGDWERAEVPSARAALGHVRGALLDACFQASPAKAAEQRRNC